MQAGSRRACANFGDCGMKFAGQDEAVRTRSLSEDSSSRIEKLAARFRTGNATVGVVGMGYVGQPLAITAHERGFRVVGFDIDSARVTALNEGHSPIRTIPDGRIAAMLRDRNRADGGM